MPVDDGAGDVNELSIRCPRVIAQHGERCPLTERVALH
jgi:hypothetical protein